MKALVITLWADKPTTIPFSYGRMIQGALYACWADSQPLLHDVGYPALDGMDADHGASKTFRLFTFGPIERAKRVDVKRKALTVEGAFSFEVRSPVDALIDAVNDHLCGTGELSLGRDVFPVDVLEERRRTYFPSRAVISMKSPLTVHTTTEDDHTRYYSPVEKDFVPLIQENLRAKANAFGMDDPGELQLLPLEESLKKRVSTFKGIYVTGWTGTFAIAAPRTTIEFLYYTGLGARNSQGYGMFDIDERPLG